MFKLKRGASRTIRDQHDDAARTGESFLGAVLVRLRMYPLSSHGEHDGLREGARLGLIVATATWFWIALVDAVSGAPVSTVAALGGVVAFTLVHFALNIAYGVALVSLIHGSGRYPSLILVALIGFAMVEIGFIMLTAVLSYFLGGIAWVSIFGGSLLGTAIAFQLLALKHPLGALLRQAEAER